MRVLMTSWAWASHYMPLVPLAWALRAAGHEVHVASQPRLTGVINDSGAAAVPVGPDLDHDEVRGRQLAGLSPSEFPRVPAAGTSMDSWPPQRVRQVFGTFAAHSEAMLDDLVAYARFWCPDLIVYEPTTYTGPLVAALLGVPAIRCVHGIDVTYQARQVVPELIREMSVRLGLGEVDILGDATVDPCPPSLQIPADVSRIPTRYVPYSGPATLPQWLRQQPSQPRVCLTWGTSASSIGDVDTSVPARLVQALTELEVDVVLALDEQYARRLGEVPANGRSAGPLALHLVLPGCAAVIHQGGNGTLLTAALCGVPQLVLPQLPGQTFRTERIVAAGVAEALLPGQFSESAAMLRLKAILTETSYRDRARSLRDEMLGMPAPADTVARLEQMAAAR